MLLVEIITISAVDDVLLGWIYAELLSKVDCKHVEVSLIQDLELLLKRLLMISEYLFCQLISCRRWVRTHLSIQSEDEQITPFFEDEFGLRGHRLLMRDELQIRV